MATVALERHIQQATLSCWETQSDLPRQSNQALVDEFEDLYRTYRSRVWALCLRMTGNPDDAEDLTQETFIRMFQKLDTFRGESAVCTWLRRIAINVVLLRFQKASWRRERSIEGLTGVDPITGCPRKMEFGCVDPQLTGAVDRITLQRAIDQLPPGFKAVFILHDIEGYEHIEISELMGCSVGTSKSQLHKARFKLRELLEQVPRKESAPRSSEANGTSRTSDGRSPVVMQFPHTTPQRYPAASSEAA
ncbi:MAG TPA: RNA polymerase sigma factor [Terriglobia bacterium]|nr:RNA polymerase sigma factor [Terriglobia bacterium]